MAKPLNTANLPWRKLVQLHWERHPDREAQRIEAEVRNFLRRAYGLAPDARDPQNGGLEGLTVDNAADAFLLVIRSAADMTQMYQRSGISE